ncbi:VOC family protein [Nocardioides sp. T2.26MG-1]|uniref:VOC family protein n=1 Tax=Nocardioides sp. T2.26MG-1 TaxID=3041166 RepID=UPI002540B30F|nr:VOC family protein [Nocardioides sp. T2.26MG-1]
MSLELVAVTYDARDPAGVAAFWGALLGREAVDGPDGVLLPGGGGQVGLEFVASDSVKAEPDRYHLHVTSAAPGDQERMVETALGLGAQHLDVGQLPEERHVVLRDPGGNEFCVIEHGNNFLAGCGLLGEVTCDGTRDVGLFWHEALGWPLVWDENEETAVQSPDGGTKVSWGGPPVAPKLRRNRQRFHLAATGLAADIARLVALGATEVGPDRGGVELIDPDGNEFLVTSSAT